MTPSFLNVDAFDLLRSLEPSSVDIIFSDPPFGSTDCTWDRAPDWSRFFSEAWRVLKPEGVLLLFAQMPLAARLVTMQEKAFRYDWIWEKPQAQGSLNANKRPMRAHEHILTFYRHQPNFKRCPIPGQEGKPYFRRHGENRFEVYRKTKAMPSQSLDGSRAPRDVIRSSLDPRRIHPTQKPIALLRAILSQYAEPDSLIVDPFAGSGSTLIAAHSLGCKSIGSELDPDIFSRAQKRISAFISSKEKARQ